MKYLTIILVVITCLSCSKEDDEYSPCDGNYIKQDQVIYDTIHGSASSYFQYQLNDLITFQDSLGNTLKFLVTYADSSYNYTSFKDACSGALSERHENWAGVNLHHPTEPWKFLLAVGRLTPQYAYENNIPSYDHMEVSIRYDITADWWKEERQWIYPESNNIGHQDYNIINGVAVNSSPSSFLLNDTLIPNIIVVSQYSQGVGCAFYYMNTDYKLIGFTPVDYNTPNPGGTMVSSDLHKCKWMLQSYW